MKNILENLIKEFNENNNLNKLGKNEFLIIETISQNFELDSDEIKKILESKEVKKIPNIEINKKYSEDLLNKILKIVKAKNLEEIKLLKNELNEERVTKYNKKIFVISKTAVRLAMLKILEKYELKTNKIDYSILNKEFCSRLLDEIMKREENENLIEETIVASNNETKYEIENENLEAQIEKEKEIMKKSIIINFFREMNSSMNNELLDNLYKAGLVINQLDDKNTISTEDLESISLTIKLFFKYLKKYKVLPKEKIDNILDIGLEEAQNFNYIGSEFIELNDIKKVKVESPGWKIENEIITKPTVKEVD
ncbi:MAG: hypothetical protein ACRCZO_13180 [Cetobacterium sp.]